MSKNIIISPSILSANFANLSYEIELLEQTTAQYIHIDVMDGKFVPPITIGALVVQSIRKLSKKIFDVHLMVENPSESLIDDFIDAGADIITVHIESVKHPARLLSYIRSKGIKAGISLIPSTDISAIKYILNEIDLVLVMSVNPGYGGQEFIHSSVSKIKELKQMLTQHTNHEILISVDGGINDRTAKCVLNAGADILVSGSFIFKAQSYQDNINKLLS